MRQRLGRVPGQSRVRDTARRRRCRLAAAFRNPSAVPRGVLRPSESKLALGGAGRAAGRRERLPEACAAAGAPIVSAADRRRGPMYVAAQRSLTVGVTASRSASVGRAGRARPGRMRIARCEPYAHSGPQGGVPIFPGGALGAQYPGDGPTSRRTVWRARCHADSAAVTQTASPQGALPAVVVRPAKVAAGLQSRRPTHLAAFRVEPPLHRGASATLALVVAAGLFPQVLSGQATSPQDKPPQAEEERTTGLPPAVAWTFNFDAGWGYVRVRQLAVQQPQGARRRRGPQRSVVRGLRQASPLSNLTTGVVQRGLRQGERCRRADLRLDAGAVRHRRLVVRSRGPLRSAGDRATSTGPGRKRRRPDRRPGANTAWATACCSSTGLPKAAAAAAIGPTPAKRSSSPPSAVSSRAAHARDFYLDKDELDESDSGSRLWGLNYELAIGEMSRRRSARRT